MKNRITYSILAGMVALSLIISGVWAWIDNSQHKSNIATGGNEIKLNDVVLVEDYKEPDDWKQGDELTKKVSVLNSGEGPIYVRVQLKEFMAIAHVDYSYTTEYLLVDTDGKFVSANDVADMKAWLAGNMPDLVYEDGQIQQFSAYGVTGKLYYFVTDATTNLNGKYGKQLLTSFTQDSDMTSLIDGVTRGSYQSTSDNQSHPTDECNYPPHLWADPHENCEQGNDGTDDHFGFHDYVEWNMGSEDNFVLLSAWDGKPTPQWILDDSSAEGWAYWGEALEPGVETAKLLESITLKQQPSGPFYYAIHVDMNAADIYQLKANFTNMPGEIAQSYGLEVGIFDVAASATTVQRSGTIRLTATWNDEAIPPANVTWSFQPVTTNGVGQNTRLNENTDVLTIGPNQSYGKIIATATYDSPDGMTKRSLIFEVVE